MWFGGAQVICAQLFVSARCDIIGQELTHHSFVACHQLVAALVIRKCDICFCCEPNFAYHPRKCLLTVTQILVRSA